MKEALTKKLGPLPRWAWAAIALTAILLYLRYRSNQAAAASAAQNSEDPYAAYNNGLDTSGYEESDAGVIPAGGGLGSGFDPTSFEEGLQYGQGFGTSTTGGTTTGTGGDTTGDQGDGSTLPSPSGPDVSINTSPPDVASAQPNYGPFSPSTTAALKSIGAAAKGGKKGLTGAKTPTKKTGTGQHPATTRHTSTGGGAPTRKSTTHTKTPTSGTHKTTSAVKLNSGGIAKAGSSVVRLAPKTTTKPKAKAKR